MALLKRDKKKKASLLDRNRALTVCPVKMPFIKKETINGKLYVTVEFIRPRWQQMLGGEEKCQRVFGLDLYGQFVYEMCEQTQSINNIIAKFAKKHNVSIAESETAVTTFIQTLMAKGLIGINMKQ